MHLVLHVDREQQQQQQHSVCIWSCMFTAIWGQSLLEEREESGFTYAHDCPTRLTASSGVILGAGTNAGVGKDGGRWAFLGSSREAGGNGASTKGNGDF